MGKNRFLGRRSETVRGDREEDTVINQNGEMKKKDWGKEVDNNDWDWRRGRGREKGKVKFVRWKNIYLYEWRIAFVNKKWDECKRIKKNAVGKE